MKRKRAKTRRRRPARRPVRRPARAPRRRGHRKPARRRVRALPAAPAAAPVPAEPASAATAAAAALSIFRLSAPEPDPAALVRRCARVVAALLHDFPELGDATGASSLIPDAPALSAVESKDDPFSGDDPFATGIAGAPPALEPVPAPGEFAPVIAYEDDPARDELARFEDGGILVNRLHPAYLRARDAGALDSHLGLCLAWALAGYVLPEAARDFIGRFLLRWADET